MVVMLTRYFLRQLTGDRIIASAHIRCLNLSEYMKIAENVKEFFHNEGIHSTTIQPEFVEAVAGENTGSISSSEDCMITCPRPGPTVPAPCDTAKVRPGNK